MPNGSDTETQDASQAVPDSQPLGEKTKLAYAPHRGGKSMWLVSALALYFSYFIFATFQCSCGRLGRVALPFSLVTLVIAFYGWIASKAKFPLLVLNIAAVIIALLLVGKNLADVLWLGHNPLFK